MKGNWVAIDVGGTFIDVVAWQAATQQLGETKLLRHELAAPNKLREAIESMLGDKAYDLIVGTTVVTNAILERKFDPTALVTTEGFADTLAIGRMRRASSYDLRARRPEPVVPEHLTFECHERIDPHGVVIRPDAESMNVLAKRIVETGVESVAVCFLHSFSNPAHEVLMKRALEQAGMKQVTLSSEILPIYGEFERMATTALNSSTRATMTTFLGQLRSSLGNAPTTLLIMSSSGAALELRDAEEVPARTVLSGPVGGVVGSIALAARHNYDNAVTLDIGGTSADVSFIEGGRLFTSEGLQVGGYPVAFPAVDIHTVSAGGGSIARVNATGLLDVGPDSAGAIPGPICYGQGGTEPTVTDCWAVLGFLGDDTMLGGDFSLDLDAARIGVEGALAGPLGLSASAAAEGVLRIVDRNVGNAIRRISVEKGRDPANAVLIAFGGAGAMHATSVARDLGIPEVLVPPAPGVFSAMGMLMSDRGMEAHRTIGTSCTDENIVYIEEAVEMLRQELDRRAEKYHRTDVSKSFRFSFDMRYFGQGRTLSIDEPADGIVPAMLRDSFASEHNRRYRYLDPSGDVEIVNIHCHLRTPGPRDDIGDTSRQTLPAVARKGTDPVFRSVTWGGGPATKVPVLARVDLDEGKRVLGPAIIEQYDTVTILHEGDSASIATDGSILISVQPEKRDGK